MQSPKNKNPLYSKQNLKKIKHASPMNLPLIKLRPLWTMLNQNTKWLIMLYPPLLPRITKHKNRRKRVKWDRRKPSRWKVWKEKWLRWRVGWEHLSASTVLLAFISSNTLVVTPENFTPTLKATKQLISKEKTKLLKTKLFGLKV